MTRLVVISIAITILSGCVNSRNRIGNNYEYQKWQKEKVAQQEPKKNPRGISKLTLKRFNQRLKTTIGEKQ